MDEEKTFSVLMEQPPGSKPLDDNIGCDFRELKYDATLSEQAEGMIEWREKVALGFLSWCDH